MANNDIVIPKPCKENAVKFGEHEQKNDLSQICVSDPALTNAGTMSQGTISVDELCAAGIIDDAIAQRVRKYIQDKCKMNIHGAPAAKKQRVEPEPKLTYANRATLPGTHPLARRLLEIMEKKKTNLCFAADMTDSEELLQLAKLLGPTICILKIHCDILKDFTEKFIKELRRFAEDLNFLIFEDRKFADIGNTVKQQYEGGLFRISSWSHIVNAHAVPGPGVLKGLSAVANSKEQGCLLIAQMSSQGCLATGEYTKAAVKMAEEHRDFVFGFICCSEITDKPEFIHLTPGVQMQAGGDALGQQYTTPEVAINKGSDVIIVGRGILEAKNRLKAAELYKQSGWEAYERKVGLVTSNKSEGESASLCSTADADSEMKLPNSTCSSLDIIQRQETIQLVEYLTSRTDQEK